MSAKPAPVVTAGTELERHELLRLAADRLDDLNRAGETGAIFLATDLRTLADELETAHDARTIAVRGLLAAHPSDPDHYLIEDC